MVIAERFHSHRRNQASSESVAEYVAELRLLATHCQFGAYLGEAVQDRLVCGLHSEDTQRCILSEVDSTLARVIEIIAQSLEAADKNAKELKGIEVPIGTVSQYKNSKRQERKPRYRV